jgi:hypothetical protein
MGPKQRMSKKAAPAAEPPVVAAGNAVVPQIGVSSVEKKSFNAEYLAMLKDAYDTVLKHDVMLNIQRDQPMEIQRDVGAAGEAGFQATWDEEKCKDSMRTAKQYQAGSNIFWTDIMSSASRGVPYRPKSILDLMNFNYPLDEDLTFFDGTIIVAVDASDYDIKGNFGALQIVSPEEEVHAAILACSEDILGGASDDRMKAWRRVFLSATMRFIVVPHDQRQFKNMFFRNLIVQKHATLARTTFQQICEISQFKELQEAKFQRTLTAAAIANTFNSECARAECQDELTQTFVDSALTVWDRALCHAEVMRIVRSFDNSFAHHSIFNDISKLQTIVYKAKTPEMICWAFLCFEDAFRHNFIPKSGVALRDIQGYGQGRQGKGIIDEFAYKYELLAFLRNDWLGTLAIKTDLKDTIRKVCIDHATIRKACGCRGFAEDVDLTWKAGWSPASDKALEIIEEAVFGIAFDPTIFTALRARKTAAECIETGTLKHAMDELGELITGEGSAVTPTTPLAGVVGAPPDPTDDGQEHIAKLKLVLEVCSVSAEMINNVTELPSEDVENLSKKRDEARRRVLTYVSLIPEETSETKLAKAIMDSNVGKLRGTTRVGEHL